MIVGGGAAGFAAAEMLRRRDYQGSIVMLSADDALPYDRPNLSKDYLAGNAPEDWVPLRPPDFYAEQRIDVRLRQQAVGIDTGARQVLLAGGGSVPYDRLLLATGAEPVRLSIPGADRPHVHTLRSLADCRAIIAAAKSARARGRHRRELHRARSGGGVARPRARGPRGRARATADGANPRGLTWAASCVPCTRTTAWFSISRTPPAPSTASRSRSRAARRSRPISWSSASACGRGSSWRRRPAWRSTAALRSTNISRPASPGIFAAGDIARWPDPHTGEKIRVEHWVVAERQGQTAALNMLGEREKFTAVPFFWSQHYDIPINYVGHAERWDEIAIDGDIAAKDCLLRFKHNGRVLAVASIFRDVASLEAEAAMERQVIAQR